MGRRLIHNELEKNAYWRPDQVAMVYEGTEHTYAAFDRRVNRTARALADLGLEPGDRLLAHGFDHVDWHTLFYACSKRGTTFCPVSRFQSHENLAYIVERLDPAVVCVTGDESIVDERLPTIREGAPDVPVLSLDRNVDAWAPSGADVQCLEGLLAEASAERPSGADDRSPDTVHSVFWTSGTTGRPKGVVRDHRASLHFADNLVNDLPFAASNRRLTTNPMMLIDAYFHYGLPTLMVGGTNVMIRSFSPSAVLEAVDAHDVDSMHLGFTLARRVLEAVAERGERLDLRYLSAVLPSANLARALDEQTDALYHLYGTTEIGLPLVTRVEPPFEGRPPLGKPGIGAEIRLVDGDEVTSEPPEPGDVGELACRGETTMTRYLDADVHEARVDDGWIRPGDVFEIDGNRDLVYQGRTDDRIRSGGVNVHPGNVEAILEEHPQVENAVVVGVPDRTWGERVCALVVADTQPAALAEALEEYCLGSDGLADEVRPREYAVVASNEEIPAGGLGKPDRGAIVDRFFG